MTHRDTGFVGVALRYEPVEVLEVGLDESSAVGAEIVAASTSESVQRIKTKLVVCLYGSSGRTKCHRSPKPERKNVQFLRTTAHLAKRTIC